ncbi:hypothetical protein ES332_A08G097900v1 [Gossypium tomentosum]|uniref:Uncharacterized protein n=1 Tax=Gossypium tomentosum TaxID=34277 RepID=A0A5D2PDT4_GOSTO|nr:hypothetical protein ES332_A08G097900v1 [Gossypium tomentosum]
MEEINWDTIFLEVDLLDFGDILDNKLKQATKPPLNLVRPRISMKNRRQLRNRDVVVRSMERKKMYVKDLEMKSRYLEGECKRLSHVLQCFIAKNQALQIFFPSSP